MKSETAKNYIKDLLNQATKDLALDLPGANITMPEAQFGDYSTNLALVTAKKMSQKPKQVADDLIKKIIELDSKEYFSEVYEKSGFINFRLSNNYLLSLLQTILEHGDLYGASMAGEGKTVLVEYFQNNVAKPPHVGHLRSAVIGDCLLRVLKSQGYKAVSDTHIGDWGTQFGILLFAYKQFIKAGGKKEEIQKDAINELNKLYVEMSAKIETDPSLHEKGKEEFAKLEKGDTENLELWQWFVQASLEDFEKYRQLLDVLPFDHNLGESFYQDKMSEIVNDLQTKNLLLQSEGAQIVNLEDAKLGIAVIIKSDNATTYLLRDLATIKYRVGQLHLSKGLYVVDNRQSHHFEQVFEIALRAGYIQDLSKFEHVDFGFMSLPEGAISTRKGTTVSLQNLITEAQKRALEIIEQKNPDLANKQAIAQLVGLAAIKYFDLSHNRKTESVFTWEKALSFEGNTGPYLQYTHARIYGILRKGNIQEGAGKIKQINQPSTLNPHESAVLCKLNQFPEIIEQVANDYLPNLLCNYLFELSQSFNSFYQEVPVLQERNDKVRSFRLNLVTATAQVIRNGLYLLGIEAPEEM